jgi:hypothetical protein
MIPHLLRKPEIFDEKNSVCVLPTLDRRGLWATCHGYCEQSGTGLPVSESYIPRRLCVHVCRAECFAIDNFFVRPGRKTGIGFPPTRSYASWHHRPPTQEAARRAEEIARGLDQSVAFAAVHPLRAIFATASAARFGHSGREQFSPCLFESHDSPRLS